MSNVFQRSLEELATTRLTKDSTLLKDIWRLQVQLNRGHFARDWVDALMQSHADKFDMYDAYGFAVLWSAILKGDIFYAVCDIGRECARNTSISSNNGVLSSLKQIVDAAGARVRCEAEFSGGLADSDGHFAWLDAMKFSRHRGCQLADGFKPCSYDEVEVAPDRLPLEVGTTMVGTSCGHIFAERGLARWPYWSTKLFLFYVRPGLTEARLETVRSACKESDAAASP
jgi:hypothetical protein